MRKKTSKAKATSKATAVTRHSTREPKRVRLPKNQKELTKLKLIPLSGDEKLAARLMKSGITSFRQLAMMSRETLLKRVGGKLTKSEEQILYATQRNARRRAVYVADKVTVGALAASQNAMWPIHAGDKKPGPKEIPCHCGCCDSIFSLKAYLFDLLDLLQQYWDLDFELVERLLQRSFSELHLFDPESFGLVKGDLNCEALNAEVPQVRIAVEVLETYLDTVGIPLPTNDAAYRKLFEDHLLRLITPQEVLIPILARAPAAAKLTVVAVENQLNDLKTDRPGDDEMTKRRRAILKQRLQPFTDALDAWKVPLNTLVLNLAGIEEAVGLLSDYTQNFTGFESNTLLGTLPENATDDQKRMREVTQKFEQGREATMRQWLADYRDALSRATKTNVEILEASLFISLSSGSCRTTTRLQELVTSVQQIVENIRSGEIARVNRPNLGSGGIMNRLQAAVTLPLAESVWGRLRDYETWLGYMYGWVYPESVLSPLVSSLDNESVEGLLKVLQTGALTAESVRELYLKAVTSLKGSEL
jgi:predicted flap endonuclease-1-like 5' DNA nuclease